MDVTVVDKVPERVWMTRRNVQTVIRRRSTGILTDHSYLNIPTIPFQIDPKPRTPEGRHSHQFEDTEPGPDIARALIDRVHNSAVKLNPSIAFDTLVQTVL